MKLDSLQNGSREKNERHNDQFHLELEKSAIFFPIHSTTLNATLNSSNLMKSLLP